MRTISLAFKRLVDVIGSLLGLILISPLLLVTAICIKITMPGPVFFRQERVTKGKKTFYILKFRTMKVDKLAEQNFDSTKDGERITPLGQILRRFKIDELPQLTNILMGDMSFVGPRPTIMQQVQEYDSEQIHRLDMRAGLTGLAQVNGNISIPWEKRIKYDLQYIEEFNLILDLKILFKTVKVVLFGEEKYKTIN